jgi:hypothetical protein
MGVHTGIHPVPQFFFQNVTMSPIQARHTVVPVERNVTQQILRSSDRARQQLRGVIANATDIARSVIEHTCPFMDFKVAPIKIENLQGAIMTAQAPFILMNVTSVVARMGYVYVPSALARHLIRRNPLNSIVWDADAGGTMMTEEQKNEASAAMWASIPYDMYIGINENTDFAIWDSNCDTVGESVLDVPTSDMPYSMVTSLIHEMVHGMGIYSLIDPNRGGGLNGHLGIFDAFIKNKQDECTPQDADSCFLFNTAHTQDIDGNGLGHQGRQLWMNTSHIYNPNTFLSGSSMSHFDSDESVMQPSITHSTCRFKMSTSDVSALVQMGWDTCNASNDAYNWKINNPRSHNWNTRSHTDNEIGWPTIALVCIGIVLIVYTIVYELQMHLPMYCTYYQCAHSLQCADCTQCCVSGDDLMVIQCLNANLHAKCESHAKPLRPAWNVHQ